MTIGEIVRYMESQKRVELLRAKERASMDYMLADLIGRSVARIHSSSAKMPPLQEFYSFLFNDEETEQCIQEKKDELSALRFRQFANSFNKRFEEGGANAK